MPRMLAIVLIVGLVSGFVVGGFHNLFTVPVMERAIVLEEQRSAKESTAPATAGDEGPLVPLGVQRVGLVIGYGILGAILGMIFAGGYAILRRVVPHWQPLALALAIGALGFWALSLFPFIRFPLNPPGVGEESSLIFRQGYQVLFMILSVVAIAVLLVGFQRASTLVSASSRRIQLYASILLGYAVFAVLIVFLIPDNPDPVPVPIDLLELFRALTMVGQFLQWALLALGVALAMQWYQRSDQAARSEQPLKGYTN